MVILFPVSKQGDSTHFQLVFFDNPDFSMLWIFCLALASTFIIFVMKAAFVDL